MSTPLSTPGSMAEGSLTRSPGRFRFRMRTLLLVPVVIAVAWWIAIQAEWLCREWVFAEERIAAQAAYHRAEMTKWWTEAQREVPRTNITWERGRDRVCRRIETPMTLAEIDKARRDIALAARRADYHDALVQKYESAMWFPLWPIEPDPPEPQ